MRGLLAKSAREAAVAVMILSAALLAVEVVFGIVLPTVHEDISAQILQLPFVRTILRALLGADIGDVLALEAVIAITWVHPVVLAIVWTQAIVLCTRVPAGEVDRGTIDLLLGLPVSRWRVYVAEAVVFMASGLALLVMGVVGHKLGILSVAPAHRPQAARLLAVMLNLYCLYLAVTGLACAVSALSDRRGRAIAVVFGILLASFLLNFLGEFWQPAKSVAFLSLLNYYQPLIVMRAGADWPIAHMAVLLGFALLAWTAGGVWFARRDICTV